MICGVRLRTTSRANRTLMAVVSPSPLPTGDRPDGRRGPGSRARPAADRDDPRLDRRAARWCRPHRCILPPFDHGGMIPYRGRRRLNGCLLRNDPSSRHSFLEPPSPSQTLSTALFALPRRAAVGVPPPPPGGGMHLPVCLGFGDHAHQARHAARRRRRSGTSRRRGCHLDDTPCLPLLKHLMKVQGGCHQMTVSPTASPARSLIFMHSSRVSRRLQ